MEPVTMWAIGFAVASVVLFTLEVVIPSGGILGVMSMGSLIGMIVCLFMVDVTYGMTGLAASLVIIPIAIGISMKIFPHTPIGKRLILSNNDGPKEEVRYSSDDAGNDDLLGSEGVVVSELRPIGVCTINGQRVECLSDHGTLEPGTRVKVVNVSGLEIKVRSV